MSRPDHRSFGLYRILPSRIPSPAAHPSGASSCMIWALSSNRRLVGENACLTFAVCLAERGRHICAELPIPHSTTPSFSSKIRTGAPGAQSHCSGIRIWSHACRPCIAASNTPRLPFRSSSRRPHTPAHLQQVQVKGSPRQSPPSVYDVRTVSPRLMGFVATTQTRGILSSPSSLCLSSNAVFRCRSQQL